MTTSGAVIDVCGVTKTYGDLTAVNDLSFDVQAGEFFGLIGPNGAGKTTTLEMIEGLQRPTSGDVQLFGRDPAGHTDDTRRRIGVQLQASAFFDRLTAREQLQTFAEIFGAPPNASDTWLGKVGLEEKADVRTEKLSGGQKQRLSIACALVHEPDLVFLDEPTAALDPQSRRNLWDLLREIQQGGRTVVLTTHYMDEAEKLCDRVAIIDHGVLLDLDTPSGLIRKLDAGVRIRIDLDALPEVEARSLPGVENCTLDDASWVLETKQSSVVLAALAKREALAGLQVHGATLDDVFLDLTGREYRA